MTDTTKPPASTGLGRPDLRRPRGRKWAAGQAVFTLIPAAYRPSTPEIAGAMQGLMADESLAKGTRLGYRCAIRMFDRWLDDRRTGGEAEPDARRFVGYLRAKIAPGTVTQYATAVRTWLRKLVDAGLLDSNPFDHIWIPWPQSPRWMQTVKAMVDEASDDDGDRRIGLVMMAPIVILSFEPPVIANELHLPETVVAPIVDRLYEIGIWERPETIHADWLRTESEWAAILMAITLDIGTVRGRFVRQVGQEGNPLYGLPEWSRESKV